MIAWVGDAFVDFSLAEVTGEAYGTLLTREAIDLVFTRSAVAWVINAIVYVNFTLSPLVASVTRTVVAPY